MNAAYGELMIFKSAPLAFRRLEVFFHQKLWTSTLKRLGVSNKMIYGLYWYVTGLLPLENVVDT